MCKQMRESNESINLADNSMLKHRPDLFNEWNFKKNNEIGLNVYKTTRGSGKKAWWTCSKCGSDYQATVKNRVNGNNCPYCRGYMVNHTNSLVSLRPDLAKEWHPTKNGKLTPHDVTIYSGKKVWWKCNNCKHEWETQVYVKTKGSKCLGCSEYRLSDETSLAVKSPELAKQWHQTKNGEMFPNDVTQFSSLKIWWTCEKGHEWKAQIRHRADGGGCPYCSNHKVLKGFNDMWTTNPTLASLLADQNDGYKFTQSGEKKVDWKCQCCNLIIKSKKINQIKNYGLSCPRCSDGRSFPEKFMFSIFNQLQVDFEPEKYFEWSNRKRYDFYLKEYNTIIEVHGIQHYSGNGFKGVGSRNLVEEQENDRVKYEEAIDNNISHYIIINASKSNKEYLKENILNSALAKLLELNKVDWSECENYAHSSIIKEICLFYKNIAQDIQKISTKFKLSNDAVIRRLKIGTEIGWCNYTATRKIKNL